MGIIVAVASVSGIACFVLGTLYGGLFVHATHQVVNAFQKTKAEATKLEGEAMATIKKVG